MPVLFSLQSLFCPSEVGGPYYASHSLHSYVPSSLWILPNPGKLFPGSGVLTFFFSTGLSHNIWPLVCEYLIDQVRTVFRKRELLRTMLRQHTFIRTAQGILVCLVNYFGIWNFIIPLRPPPITTYRKKKNLI